MGCRLADVLWLFLGALLTASRYPILVDRFTEDCSSMTVFGQPVSS